jgi:hypothetical protein
LLASSRGLIGVSLSTRSDFDTARDEAVQKGVQTAAYTSTLAFLPFDGAQGWRIYTVGLASGLFWTPDHKQFWVNLHDEGWRAITAEGVITVRHDGHSQFLGMDDDGQLLLTVDGIPRLLDLRGKLTVLGGTLPLVQNPLG